MIWRRIIVGLVIFNLYILAWAQIPFTGKVLDGSSEPLSYATIAVRYIANDSLVVATSTNSEGYFLLSIPKEIELNSLKGEISFIGYETLIVTPIPNDFKEYFLHPKSQLLEEITIISERKWLNMVPGGVEYNLKTLKLDEVGSALNAIGQLPRIIQEGRRLSVIGRGQPLIYINGRLSSIDDLALIDASDIVSVKLITDPGVRYSSETNSVLEVKTRNREDGFGGMLYTDLYVGKGISSEQYGSFTYRKGALDLFFTLGNSINNSTISQSIDLDLLNRGISFDQRGDLKMHSLSQYAILGINFFFSPKHQAGIKYTFDYLPKWNVKTELKTCFQGNTNLANEINQVDFDMKSTERHINLYYLGKLSPIYTLRVDGDIVNFKGDRSSVYNIITESSEKYNSNNFSKSFLIAGKIQNQIQAFGGEFILGTEIAFTKNEQDFLSTLAKLQSNASKMYNNLIAGFLSFSKAWEKYQITGGLRYEYNMFDFFKHDTKVKDQSRVYRNFVPYFSLNYNGDLMANLTFSQSLKKPSYNQLNNSEQFNNNYWYERGNQYLNTEKNNNFTLNLSKWGVVFSARYTFSKEKILFYTSFDNDRGVLISSPVNVSLTQQIGIYTSYSKRFWNTWEPTFELSYNKPLVRYQDIYYTKPSWTMAMKNRFYLPYGINVNFNGIWVSEGSRGLETGGAYSKIDIKANKSFFENSLRISIGVEDILQQLGTWSEKRSTDFVLKLLPTPDSKKFTISLRYYFNQKKSRYKGIQSTDEIKRL